MFRKRAKSDSQAEYTCSVRFLDDAESIQLTFKKDTLGQWLFDRVCEKLNLLEKDYFGLRYVDADNQRHWLDPLKTVYKQLKGILKSKINDNDGLNKMVLCFRAKFYPEDPMKMHEEITRYYLFLQLRRDLHHGRLLCPHEESIQLAAYIIQSEVGDYDPQDHGPGYVSEFKMLPKQTPKHEEKIIEAHKALSGIVPQDCETSFLKKASTMDTYGVDPHQVKDQRGDQLYLGVTHLGIMTFRGNRRTQLFKWAQIRRIAYENKMFIVHHLSSQDEDMASLKKKHQAVGFKCASAPAAKYLWRCAVEQQLFFTLSTSTTVPKIRSGGTIFSRGSKFRFSGRCQNEAYEASDGIKRSEPPFARTSSLPNFGKKHLNDSKNNTNRNSLASESFREDLSRRKYNEAAVDVPNMIMNESITVMETAPPQVAQTPSPNAPLATQEDQDQVEERLQPVIACSVSAVSHSAAPQLSQEGQDKVMPKMNGKIVTGAAGVLETSIDDSPAYEPDRTRDDSDEEEDTTKPSLDEQIHILEQEMEPILQREISVPVPPTKVASPASSSSSSSSSSSLKPILLSLLGLLLLSIAVFYLVFFCPQVQHPLLSDLRRNLHFLEPVRDFVGNKASVLSSLFRK